MMVSLKEISTGLKIGTNPESIIIHDGETELLAEVILGKRKQMVSISVQPNQRQKYSLVQIRSRACPATSASIVKTALISNSLLGVGGFVLTMQDGVAVIDVKHNIIGDRHSFTELVFAISVVARTADSIEAKVLGHDVF